MKTEQLAAAVVERLRQEQKRLCTAESCTGGLIGKLLTDVPGSSSVYMGGVISYTNEVKQSLLHVRPQTLQQYTAVSAQTAQEMAAGARGVTGADIAVSVTGLAGPDGDGTGRAVGLVYIGYCDDSTCFAQEFRLTGDRAQIRLQAAEAALELILQHING